MRRLSSVVVALGLAGCAAGQSGDGRLPFTAVATVDQIMDALVIPSSQALFDSVVYVNGELATSPTTDDDWFRLQMQAIAVAEAGNLLLIPPRSKGEAEWVAMAQAMTAAAVRVQQAAEAKNVDLMLQTGSDLYETCTSCHGKYGVP